MSWNLALLPEEPYPAPGRALQGTDRARRVGAGYGGRTYRYTRRGRPSPMTTHSSPLAGASGARSAVMGLLLSARWLGGTPLYPV